MMKGLVFRARAAVFFAATLCATPALADNAAPLAPLEQPDPDATRWYGLQTLALDVPAVALLVAAITEVRPGGDVNVASALLAGGIPLFVLGPPIVHAAHERFGAGVGDFVLRGAVTGVSALVGLLSTLQNNSPCPPNYPDGHCAQPIPVAIGIGIASALGGVSAIDAAVLALEPATDGSAATPQARASWSPIVTVTQGGGRSIGIQGVF
jgi:hypothetical protein